MMPTRLIPVTCLEIHYHEEHPEQVVEILFQIPFLGRAEWIPWSSYEEFYDNMSHCVLPEVGQTGKLEMSYRQLKQLDPDWQYAYEDWKVANGK